MYNKEEQNNWKRQQRELNTPYAIRVRESKLTKKAKDRRKELRARPESKAKENEYQKIYRKRPDVKAKNQARYAVKKALIDGILKRPDNCELCKSKDIPLKDGRTGLRADHYLGYEKENHLKVKFICVSCDGKQLRKY